MPIDASIALGAKAPDQMQSLSSLMTAANGAQNLQLGAQNLQNNSIALGERQGLQQFMSNPQNYMDADGNVDMPRATQGIMKVAPTTGLPVIQGLMTAQKQHTEATSALSTLDDQDRTRIANTLAVLKPDTPPDVVHGTLDALDKAYKGRIRPMVTLAHNGYDAAYKQGPDAVQGFLTQATKSVLPQPTQQDMNSGSLSAISTDQGTQLVQTKVGASQPVGPVGAPFAPPNQIVTTPTGQLGAIKPTSGNFTPATSAGSAAPVNFPNGENKETWADLQGQRTAAQQSANTAPVLHDINRTIVSEANKGLNTGALGHLTQKLASATGYTIAPGSSTDYNMLGKMLERSALQAAQGMGPHTNAGLEASVRANGSLDYTPQAIKKIAYLNDALTTGSELYRAGLENAVSSDPNGVFAKRKFDQEWAKVATPQALRLKNAVDNGDREEIDAITKEVGGKASDGAKKLHQQLTQMLKLTGQ